MALRSSQNGGYTKSQKGAEMNDENLIPFNKRSPRERREISRKGAEATNKKKKEQKTMREMMKMLLELDVKPSDKEKLEEYGVSENDHNNKCMVAVGLMQRAMTGDPRAVEVLCGIAGDIFTIDKTEQEENEVEQTIKRLSSLEVKFVDASKGEEKK